ncbi:MAG: helix-turn-helix transcriptional regulator [Anaerolineae bacterium]|nr:helix-turn-helix transcriptional regulator [Anaerolineae bacterium]
MADQQAQVLRDRVIGVLLRDARLWADKSVGECAHLLGVSPETITAYEEGEESISLPELEVLASFLGVSVSRFWDPEATLLAEAKKAPNIDQILALRHRIVGALLRQARMDAHKTQQDLADEIGASASRISAYEYGKQPIPLSELEQLAEAVGRPVTYFLGERVGPLAEWERQREVMQVFKELPVEIQDFVGRPINQSYLRVAMKLEEMSAESLRTIAEGLLEITF